MEPLTSSSLSNSVETDIQAIRKRRNDLWKVIVLSSGVDIAMSFAEVPFLVQTLGGSLVVEEIMEFFISRWIAGSAIDLKKRYKILGLIPIPGVTSLSIQALLTIRRLNKEEAQLLSLRSK